MLTTVNFAIIYRVYGTDHLGVEAPALQRCTPERQSVPPISRKGTKEMNILRMINDHTEDTHAFEISAEALIQLQGECPIVSFDGVTYTYSDADQNSVTYRSTRTFVVNITTDRNAIIVDASDPGNTL